MFRRLAVLASALVFLAAPAARAAPPVEVYGKLPGIELVTLSPSGQRYAFIATVGEARRLVALDADGDPLIVVPVGNAKVRALEWAGEDHLLVTITTTVNLGMDFTVFDHELSSVVAINVKAKKSFVVFQHYPYISQAVFGHYGDAEINGHWYGFFGGITYGHSIDFSPILTHSYPDLYRVDLDTGDVQIAAPGLLSSDGWLVGPSGEVIARSEYDQESGAWRVIEGGLGGKTLAHGASKLGGAGLSRAGRRTRC